MRWTFTTAFVFATWIWVSQTTTLEIIAVPTSISKSKPTLTEVKIPPAASTLVTETNKPEQSEINGGSSVSNVGEPMDPDEPWTWPLNTEFRNIGEPMDPDDASTWPQPRSTEIIYIGDPMDPDDSSTWPQPQSTETIYIGEPMNPDDPSTWPQPETSELINIGDPMDPDDPNTWPEY